VHLQVVAYELLLRRLIRGAPNAALLAFEGFLFASYNGTTAAGEALQIPAPYYNTGIGVCISRFEKLSDRCGSLAGRGPQQVCHRSEDSRNSVIHQLL
jgi:hypothetical protein